MRDSDASISILRASIFQRLQLKRIFPENSDEHVTFFISRIHDDSSRLNRGNNFSFLINSVRLISDEKSTKLFGAEIRGMSIKTEIVGPANNGTERTISAPLN